MNFQPRNSHTTPLFKKNYFLKYRQENLERQLRKYIIYKYIYYFINNLLPSLFNNWFGFSSDIHNYNISWSSNAKLRKYSYRTNTYGKNSITVSAIKSLNNSQNHLKFHHR